MGVSLNALTIYSLTLVQSHACFNFKMLHFACFGLLPHVRMLQLRCKTSWACKWCALLLIDIPACEFWSILFFFLCPWCSLTNDAIVRLLVLEHCRAHVSMLQQLRHNSSCVCECYLLLLDNIPKWEFLFIRCKYDMTLVQSHNCCICCLVLVLAQCPM
jgi:hypothetical protein